MSDPKRRTPRLLHLRFALRELEFNLPLSVQGPVLRLLGRRFDPYDDVARRTRSIFVHVPRTGGTSVGKALNRPMLHYAASRYAIFDQAAFRDYFKFAFVRNPWDRLLSGYSRLKSSGISPEATAWAERHMSRFASFEEFVLALRDPRMRRELMSFVHFRTQLSWLSFPGQRKAEMDFVGRFERFADDFAVVCRYLGVDAALEAGNASVHPPYRELYTPAMRSVVADVYRDDIEAFEYEF